MISREPSAELLRSADMIALYDPNVPGWSEVVVSDFNERIRTPRGFVAVEVPVDSSDPAALKRWRERILSLWRAGDEG